MTSPVLPSRRQQPEPDKGSNLAKAAASAASDEQRQWDALLRGQIPSCASQECWDIHFSYRRKPPGSI